jgi:hypothetical protein
VTGRFLHTIGGMELEPVAGAFEPTIDRRPRVPEPLPVRLLTVGDASLPAAAGIERQLDRFYVTLLGFERRPPIGDDISYRADNFALTFDVVEPPLRRDDVRPLGVEVPSLAELESKLIEAEWEYTRQRGLLPGEEMIVLLDPAGNWLEIVDRRGV